MNEAVEYRRSARQARAVAESVKDTAGRERLLRIAAAWDKMASDCEQESARRATWTIPLFSRLVRAFPQQRLAQS
ncbi:MAG TPA: hypothetical protein VFW28_18685 [Micropepsaceae bacterium]|nr:hypothetical protein [Micropepsaceae bacterium]